MLSYLAFLLPMAITATKTTEAPRLPTFASRWWFKSNRLDARPVAWSLRTRPQDWEWEHEDYTIRHKPSQHIFWIANGLGYYRLYDANCSCTSRSDNGRFQHFQQMVFHRAFKCWRQQQHPAVDTQHFASHFVRAD